VYTFCTLFSWRARPRWSQGDREGELRLTPPPSGALVLLVPRRPPPRSFLAPPRTTRGTRAAVGGCRVSLSECRCSRALPLATSQRRSRTPARPARLRPASSAGQRERPASSAMRQRALAPAQEPPKRSARVASFVEGVCGLAPARPAGEVADLPPCELPTDR
jgi:hypothetical protein